MSSQYWKYPRSNLALAQQWLRRVGAPLPFILEEVNKRMVARAQIMRPVEGGVVHQGWLHPATLSEVKSLFVGRPFTVFAPRAIELPVASVDRAAASFLAKLWPGRSAAPKASHATALVVNGPLPLVDASQAMVWSPLWLHCVEDPGQQLAEWLRVLKPEGGVFFSCFGPDTAKELQGVALSLGEDFPDFADMHDIGDLMGKQGFSDPVMEMEKLTLTYTTPEKLLADWRALVGNPLQQRQKGLCAPVRYSEALIYLEGLRNPDTGRIPLTLELVYGHAWKVKRMAKTDIATVKVSDIKGRKGSK
ncbi:MAG: methyltransferase domain-containing protein [Limnobacter sp.]|uniref:methyltransferase domain-containing protein n=1 Tax=Limnobacter sp. TaxID=2003368 RepID=UPI0032EC2844